MPEFWSDYRPDPREKQRREADRKREQERNRVEKLLTRMHAPYVKSAFDRDQVDGARASRDVELGLASEEHLDLRVGVDHDNYGVVMLDRVEVERLRDLLNVWLVGQDA